MIGVRREGDGYNFVVLPTLGVRDLSPDFANNTTGMVKALNVSRLLLLESSEKSSFVMTWRFFVFFLIF